MKFNIASISIIILFNIITCKSIKPDQIITINTTKEDTLPRSVADNISNDTLIYYLVNVGSEQYKLFGFYSTDINLLLVEISKLGFISLSEKLVELNILSKKESKLFTQCIRKELYQYPTALNKPCVFLKYYFKTEEVFKANSIILPVEPLKSKKV